MFYVIKPLITDREQAMFIWSHVSKDLFTAIILTYRKIAASLHCRLWPVMPCANEFRDFLSLCSYTTKGKQPKLHLLGPELLTSALKCK